MYMKDWIAILDDFLRISRKDILTHAGRISAQLAKAKADSEYDPIETPEKKQWYERYCEMKPVGILSETN